MAEKALKFAKKADKSWDEPEVDRSNMLLFPTIASCTSSDSEEETTKGEMTRDSNKDADPAKAEDVVKPDDTAQSGEPSQHTKHHHHHRHRHHRQCLVSYQTLSKYSVIADAHSTEAHVTISPPSSVTIMVCSNWAQRLWSLVATVQPSSHTNVSPLPSTSIGSMVNTWSTLHHHTRNVLFTILPPHLFLKWRMYGSMCM